MDPLTRVFPGQFQSRRIAPHPDLITTTKPYVQVELLIGRERLAVPFMIDTGADFTIVQPRIAAHVLRADARRSRRRGSDIVHISGVGQGSVRTRVRTVGVSLRDVSNEPYWFTHSVLLAEPVDPGPMSATWILPSLLGRDILQRFNLNLSYDPPSVSLILNH